MRNAIFGALCALALIGCGGGGGGGAKAVTKARVAYVDASPDAGDVGFVLNREVKATVTYGAASAFAEVKPDDYDVAVQPSGASETFGDEAHGFATDTDNLVIALGLETPPSDGSTPPVVEEEKRLRLTFGTLDRTPPVGNRTRLVIVHAFVRKPGFGTPAVDFRSPGDIPTVDVEGIQFGGLTTTTVDSGPQTFQVRQNGTEQVFIADKTFTLTASGIYVVLITGVEGATGAQAPDIRLIPIPTRIP